MNTRRLSGLLPLLLLFSTLCACGPKVKTISPEKLRYKLFAAYGKADDFNVTLSSDEEAADAFAAVSELDASVAESFLLATAKDGKASADEIAVILVKNEAALPDVTASLEAHLESRKKLYAASAPLQKEKLDAGEVFTLGRYAVLLVSEDIEALKNAFLAAVQN